MFFVGSLTVPLAYATHYEILNVRCSGRLPVRGVRHCDAKYTKKPKFAEQKRCHKITFCDILKCDDMTEKIK